MYWNMSRKLVVACALTVALMAVDTRRADAGWYHLRCGVWCGCSWAVPATPVYRVYSTPVARPCVYYGYGTCIAHCCGCWDPCCSACCDPCASCGTIVCCGSVIRGCNCDNSAATSTTGSSSGTPTPAKPKPTATPSTSPDVRVLKSTKIEDATTSQVETSLTVHVPESAEVFLSGIRTKANGPVRRFSTRRLAAGQQWSDYTVRVTVRRNGRLQTRQQSISLEAGESHTVRFDFDQAAVASLGR